MALATAAFLQKFQTVRYYSENYLIPGWQLPSHFFLTPSFTAFPYSFSLRSIFWAKIFFPRVFMFHHFFSPSFNVSLPCPFNLFGQYPHQPLFWLLNHFFFASIQLFHRSATQLYLLGRLCHFYG